MVRPCRPLVALVMTKKSVMASTAPTSSTTVSRPCLSSAARAAVTAQSSTTSRSTRGEGLLTKVSLLRAGGRGGRGRGRGGRRRLLLGEGGEVLPDGDRGIDAVDPLVALTDGGGADDGNVGLGLGLVAGVLVLDQRRLRRRRRVAHDHHVGTDGHEPGDSVGQQGRVAGGVHDLET